MDSTKCEPSREKLNDFVVVRSPLVTLLCCVFSFGCTFIIYGNMIVDNQLIPDPDVVTSWNKIFENLNSREYCLSNKTFKAAKKLDSDAEYHIISLTSRVEYAPHEGYYDAGDYHLDSASYPASFGFTLKPAEIGILPLEMPKNWKLEREEFEYKKDSTIFVTMALSKKYDSEGKCEITKTPNRYGKGYDETGKCGPDDGLYACFTFYFHKKLYEHTTDLVHAVIPKADISEADDDTLDTTFECKSPPSDARLGTAEYQANLDEDGVKPCHSRLYLHSKHSTDPGLVKMMPRDAREKIQKRLFWLGLSLIGICALFAVFGAFRGSTNAIHLFNRNRNSNNRFSERESNESQRL